jgi:hypothetical protein
VLLALAVVSTMRSWLRYSLLKEVMIVECAWGLVAICHAQSFPQCGCNHCPEARYRSTVYVFLNFLQATCTPRLLILSMPSCFGQFREKKVGCEALTAVVMTSSIFRDITLCSPLKVNPRFGGTCRLHPYSNHWALEG